MQGITIRIIRGHGDQVETIEVAAEPARAVIIDVPRVGPLSPPATRYVVNGDGTVTDTTTGLMWSQDDVTPKAVKHAAAEKACAEIRLAGYADWRLPTRAELLTLVDDTRHEPAIDVQAFPACKSNWYWTSTIAAWSSVFAWIVYFSLGDASYGRRSNDLGFVRAVRSVPAGQ